MPNKVESSKVKLSNEIGEILIDLKKSPAFAMSRGGRELFHTNFLAYILDLDDDTMRTLNSEYVKSFKNQIISNFFKNKNIENVITFREKNNLDLIIIPNIKNALTNETEIEVVIIEAKLKAIPTNEQLIEYNNKLLSGIRLDLDDTETFEIELQNRNESGPVKFSISSLGIKLLNVESGVAHLELKDESFQRQKRPKEVEVKIKKLLLAPSTNISEIDTNLNWEILDWSSFLKNISPSKSTLVKPSDNSLISQLIKSYLDSTNQIIDVANYSYEQAEQYITDKINFDEFQKISINHIEFKKIRLHDLVGKICYHKLHLSLYQSIQKCEVILNIVKTLPPGFKLNAYSFYSRSIPGVVIEFKKVVKKLDKKVKSISIGVQLQGDSYRHFINRENFNSPKKSLPELGDEIIQWLESVGEKKTKEKFRVFDVKRFVYLHKKVEDQTLYRELSNSFIESLTNASRYLTSDFVSMFEQDV